MNLDISKELHLSNKSTLDFFSLLKATKTSKLQGGLRCTTVKQQLSCELVIKKGDYQEFVEQLKYQESLPEEFQKYFPRLLQLDKLPDSKDGILIMEKLPGESLHEFLYDIYIDDGKKIEASQKLLKMLGKMHTFDLGSLMAKRDLAEWSQKLDKRVNGLSRPLDNLQQVSALIAKLKKSQSLEVVKAAIIHGDAQPGNFIVNLLQDKVDINFIDPLGGSGSSPGDYVYDLSRLYHWIDCVSFCYEREKSPANIFIRKQSQYLKVRGRVLSLILQQLEESAAFFKDRNAKFWFYIYCAYHMTGKLNNFLSDEAQRIQQEKLQSYLESAR